MQNSMAPIIIVLILCVYAFLASTKVYLQSKYSKTSIHNVPDVLMFLTLIFAIMGVFFLIFALINNQINFHVAIYALIMGAFTFLFQLFYTLSFKEGPMGLTVFFVSLSSVLLPIYSLFRFNEQFSIFKIIALALLVASFAFNIKKSDKKANIKWIFFLILTAIGHVSYKIVQAEFSRSDYGSNNYGFLSLQYLFAALFAIISLFVLMALKKKPTIRIDKRYIGFSSSIAFILSGCVFLLYMAISNGDVSFVYPLESGLCLLFSTIFALVLYKEKLTIFQWISFGLGLASIVLINI